jgi:hypothetical protein
MKPRDLAQAIAMTFELKDAPTEKFVVAAPLALEVLCMAIVHGSDSDREAAGIALVRLGRRGVNVLLVRAMSRYPNIRDLAWGAIERAPLEARLNALRQLDPAKETHVPLLARLVGCFDAEAVPYLRALLYEPEPGLQVKAATALSHLGAAAASARPRLEELAKSSDPLVRVAAERALEHAR